MKRSGADRKLRRSCVSGAIAFVLATLAAVFAAPAAFAQASTTQVSSGGHHACAVSPTGGLTCWGRNLRGELGDGTNTNNGSPVQVSGLTSGIVQVTGGGEHTCALTSGGAVKCWGFNDYGQLGQSGGTRNTPGDVPSLASGVIQVEAGELHTCALTAAGGVQCWGNNSLGQLGDTTTTTRSTPAAVTGLTSGVKAIASGDSHTCALLTDGTAKCWGLNEDGQLGNGVNTPTGVGVTSPVTVTGLAGTIAQIATGRTHTCALMGDGSVSCWGRNSAGQLGRGTITTPQLAPGVVSGLGSGVARIELGFEHSCAVLATGEARCWGKNVFGQVGNGTVNLVDGVATPTTVHGLASGVADVSAAFEHTCWITLGGSLRCNGRNIDGRVGDGTTGGSAVLSATNVVGLTAGVAATQIASGGAHTCQVNSGGVMCWGRNTEGQLGDAGNTDSRVPVPVSGLAGITSVATGGFHACALGSGGGLKCWGANGAGQLGAAGGNSNTPVDVTGLASGVAAVVAGESFNCALTTGGGVKCWGANNRGQLGNGNNTGGSTPVDVTGLASGVTAIAAGRAHACAVLGTGGAKCWGWNERGQLGNGTLASNDVNGGINTPVDVAGMGTPIERVAAGGEFTCATVGGGAKCWGHGDVGQLGNSPLGFADSLSPVDVTGLTAGVALLAAGETHACAVTTAGAMKCWGGNDSGQLGRGTIEGTGVASPVAVTAMSSGVIGISANWAQTCALVTGGWARCWGENGAGRLGDGTIVGRSTPTEVVARAQWLTFAPATPIKVGAPASLAATASSALAATFDRWTSTTCGISGSTLTANSVGLCGVRASQGGNASFHAAPQQLRVLVVIKGDQAITFNALANKTFNDAPFGVSATGGATGNPVAFSSLTTPVCTSTGVNGTTITIVGAGLCTIAADQAGSDDYNAAPQVTQSFTVLKDDQAITFNALGNKTYGDAPFGVSATSANTPNSGNPVTFSSLTGTVCTSTGANGATITLLIAGDCTIAANQAGTGNYDPAPQVTRTFTVLKAPQAISFAALADKTFGDAPFGISATGGGSGNAVTFSVPVTTSVCSVAGATVTIVGGGTCSIQADQAGDSNHLAAPPLTRNFTVNKANQTISFGALANKTFNDAPFGVSASASPSGLTVVFSSLTTGVCTVSGTTVTIVGGGTCTVAADQPGNANYNAAPQVTQGFTVAKDNQAISFGALGNKTFNDAPFGVSASASPSGLTVTFSSLTTGVCTVSGTTVTLIAAGPCQIAADQAGNGNYNAATQVIRGFTVAKDGQTISFGALANKQRVDPPFGVSATVSSGLTVVFSSLTTSVCTVSGTTVTIQATGSCTIAANQAGDANYAPAPQVTQGFTVLVSVPGAPLIGASTPGNQQARIAFSPPATDGGSAITSYSATCNPGGLTGTSATSPVTVAGLTNGTTYGCSVTATNGIGTGAASGTVSVVPSAGPFAFVANSGASTVGVIDLTTDLLVAAIGVGSGPTAAAVTPNAARAYVANTGAGTVSVVDTATNAVTATITVGTGPAGIAILPNGARAYVANRDTDDVSVIDTTLQTVSTTVTVGDAPSGIAASVTGDKVFVANGGSNDVKVIDTASNLVTATIPVGSAPRGVAARPNGGKVYVANSGGSSVSVISSATNAVTSTITVPGSPLWIAFRHDGARAYVGHGAGNGLTVIDAANDAVITTITVGGNVGGVTVTPDNAEVLVAVDSTNEVKLVSTASNTVTLTLAGFSTPSGTSSGFAMSILPGAPTINSATPGDDKATIAFTAPANNGGAAITSYQATCNPGGFNASGAASPLVVTGLTDGTPYTCTVTATNAVGTGPASAGASVTPYPPPVFTSANNATFTVLSGNTFTVTANGTPTPTLSRSGDVLPAGVTFVGGTGVLSGTPGTGTVGTYNITFTATNLSGATPQPFTLTVIKKDQTIAFTGPADQPYTPTPIPLSATATSGLTVAFSSLTPLVCSVSGTSLTLLTTGTCTVAANQGGNGDYNAAPQVTDGVVVSQAAQAITFNALTGKTFGDAPFTVSATGGASGNPVTFTSTTTGVCTVSGTNGSTITIVAVGAGTCTIQADQAGNGNYTAAPPVQQGFVVAKAGQAISFGAIADRNLPDTPFTVSATGGGSGNAVTFSSTTPSVCTSSGPNGTTISLLTIGTCTIAADQAGNGNYIAAPQVTRSFGVGKASQTITFNALANKTFLDAPFGVSASAVPSGLTVTFSSLTTGVCTVSGTTVTIVAAGTCTVAADQAGNASYNAAPQVTRSFTVNKAAQAITFNALSARNFGDPPFGVSATASPSGLTVTFSSLTTTNCTVSGTTVTLAAAGTCTIAADQAGNANYNAAPQVTRSFAINATVPGAPTIGAATPGNGQAAIAFTAPASNGGSPITSYTATCNPGAITGSGAASPVTVTGLTNGTGYTCSVRAVNSVGASAASGTVGVTPVAPALTLNPTSLAFGGQSMGTSSPTQSITVTNSGTSALTISAVSVSNAQFDQAHNCTTLAPAATCSIVVDFTPNPTGDPLNAAIPVAGALSITSNAGGSPHTAPLSGTAEKSLITHYYRSILRRAPDTGGKNFWTSEAARVANLGANVNEVWFAMSQAFYFSAEYTAFNRDNTGYVTDLYNTFFNRAPDSGGLNFWVGQLDSGMPREVALASFMFSAEFGAFTSAIFGNTAARAEVNAVVDFYRGLLARLPDDGGFNFWVGRFRTAQCQNQAAIVAQVEAISSAFATSGEYVGRNRTNAQYVGDLYNAFLRRGGDLGGVQFWINQIATAARTREQVRIEFKNSAEFQARVQAIINQGCLP